MDDDDGRKNQGILLWLAQVQKNTCGTRYIVWSEFRWRVEQIVANEEAAVPSVLQDTISSDGLVLGKESFLLAFFALL